MRISALAALAAASALVADTPAARACGCLSSPMPPPVPPVGEVSYTVNQQAEQIIFEAEPGWVTAHVMIRYAGDPASFAWLVPVPEVPELAIDPPTAFGLLDGYTAPTINVSTEDICPQSQWACQYHAPLYCGPGGADYGVGLADAGFASSDAPVAPGGSGVTVISTQTVGDYQTVVFRATEANLATQWLRDNGFIVNNTTSIYMESYVSAGMVFVAAKLVPGAGVSSIKPLRMKYRAANPTVPLILTAVAAQPNLTVTSFIYSNTPYRPLGHPVVQIDPKRLAKDTLGRLNYPQVLSRMIDEAGGDAFVYEYRGGAQLAFTQNYCCSSGFDTCGIGFDNQCECPGTEFDARDCSQIDGLNEGAQLVTQLGQKYQWLTRITTRVSPEEMTFDPAFEPDPTGSYMGNLTLSHQQASLQRCGAAVRDQAKLAAINAAQACAATYCGPHGQCVVSGSGPACACEEGFVAMQYTDLDSQQSVTCVPATPPVDLRAGGAQIPDACATTSCGNGTCVDRNGIATCVCNANTAAAPRIAGSTPFCSIIESPTGGPGAQDYSGPLRALAVCAPRYPSCGPGGWLSPQAVQYPGVDCGDATPPAALTREPEKPTCGWFSGCGCQGTPDGAPLGALGAAWLVGIVLLRRRRA
ncbi:MAG: DUF2330 domain-containing protein [Deltaproteobacteria bacterium]|nr:DUF2330 domain-containing protein [Deltaproteobacteria bacterium]